MARLQGYRRWFSKKTYDEILRLYKDITNDAPRYSLNPYKRGSEISKLNTLLSDLLDFYKAPRELYLKAKSFVSNRAVAKEILKYLKNKREIELKVEIKEEQEEESDVVHNAVIDKNLFSGMKPKIASPFGDFEGAPVREVKRVPKKVITIEQAFPRSWKGKQKLSVVKKHLNTLLQIPERTTNFWKKKDNWKVELAEADARQRIVFRGDVILALNRRHYLKK